MELKFDITPTYAIALEGGGAKGAYEIGVWKALDEAGVRYNAVSGTSVGALNGSLMAMRDLDRAIRVWSDMRLTKVISMDEQEEQEAHRLMSGAFQLDDIHQLLPQAMDILKNRGLDIAPLRAWVREVVDAKAVKASDVELFVSTVDLTDRRGLEIKVNDLPEDEVCDMLLASAYHPSFRLEPLGGKLYADGGFFDSIPIHSLVENGYKDIIAVRMPGMGIERRFRLPGDVTVTEITPTADLGFVLNFDAAQSKHNMTVGYLDGQRLLYGLYGRRFYIDRSMTERQALEQLLDWNQDPGETMRSVLEREIPHRARRLDAADGDYYDIMIAQLEEKAADAGIDPLRVYTDRELLELCIEV